MEKYTEKINSIIKSVYDEAFSEGKKRGWNDCRSEISHTAVRVTYYTSDGKEVNTYKYTIPDRK